MNTTTHPVDAFDASPTFGWRLWTGRALSALVIAFLAMDGFIKLVPIQPVFDAMAALGFATSPALARALGVLLLSCTAIYAVPRTALVGAILLTGYLGGAIAVNVRADMPLFSHVLFGSYLGIMLWAGLLLRSERARAALFVASFTDR